MTVGTYYFDVVWITVCVVMIFVVAFQYFRIFIESTAFAFKHFTSRHDIGRTNWFWGFVRPAILICTTPRAKLSSWFVASIYKRFLTLNANPYFYGFFRFAGAGSRTELGSWKSSNENLSTTQACLWLTRLFPTTKRTVFGMFSTDKFRSTLQAYFYVFNSWFGFRGHICRLAI